MSKKKKKSKAKLEKERKKEEELIASWEEACEHLFTLANGVRMELPWTFEQGIDGAEIHTTEGERGVETCVSSGMYTTDAEAIVNVANSSAVLLQAVSYAISVRKYLADEDKEEEEKGDK